MGREVSGAVLGGGAVVFAAAGEEDKKFLICCCSARADAFEESEGVIEVSDVVAEVFGG